MNAGGSTTNSPATATDNGSITGYAVQSPGTYSGTISVNSSGVVSISGAAPVGAHAITIRATDNCGATTDATFTLTVGNNPPTITAGAALTRQRGTAGSVSTIATVSDSETAAASLVVTATTVPAGITVASITNTAGTISATVAADCTATLGANTVVLTVTDGNSGTATANLTVNVTANTAPTLTYAAASVNAGGSTTNSPTTATDNGSITGYAVQSQGSYTGTISVNASGVVSISSAAPVGAHAITIRATDNCGATTDATFTLTVGNNPPTITAGAALTRQRGTAGSVSTIATVSDSETAAASLVVTATTVPGGITVASIRNTAGTISATVAADCTATIGANIVVLTVTDGNSGTATANLTVSVAANTPPTVSYAAASVNAGGSTTNSTTTATDNGSITGYAVQSQGTYTGTISVNASGVVSISSAAPVGAHTITIRATDNCGANTDATFTLTVGNNPPTITAGAALNRQRGTAGSVSTIAAVSDSETPVGSLVVTATTVPAGITVTSITNTAGTIMANVAAGCTATLGANTIVLTVTDGNSGTATASLTVNVTANSAPTLTYAVASVSAGGSTTNSPAAATDNGSITGYAVQSQGTYAGTIAVNSSGVVSIGSAAPVGAHTITIRATDNCGATTDATFTLTVGNNLPTITAAAALTRQRGTPGSASTIATVSDGETAAASLTVAATTIPAGITVISITNTAGTIAANVAASCTATLGANTVGLTVTDGDGGTATASLTVNVTANSAPTLTYGNASVNAGASTTNSPTTATDNGSITGYNMQSQGTYTGTISVNASGVVSISSAAPVGAHTITIRATDNCGTTTDATFTLTVGNNLPTITPGVAATRQQGSAGTTATIATVSDGETPVGSLTVTATTVPAGITITGITNTAGTITATVAAGCAAIIGANTVVLTVTDGNSGTATANLTVNVTANAAPTLTYNTASVTAGSATTVSTATASDNGLITGYSIVSAVPAMSTAPTVNASGVVSITNAGPSGAHTITVRATDNCGAATDASFTLNVGCPAITLNPTTLPGGTTGTNYSQTISATGGAASPGFAVTGGSLPSGLSLSAAGALSGSPNAAGTFTFTVTATDANNCTGAREYAITICAPPSITTPPVSQTKTVGQSVTFSVTAAGTGLSYQWRKNTVNINGATSSSYNIASVVPGDAGSYDVVVTGTCGSQTSNPATLTVNCQTITVSPASLGSSATGAAFSQVFTQTGGIGAITWSLIGTPPPGLGFNAGTATLSGSPTTSGSFTFTIRATDANGCTGERQYTLGVDCASVMVSPANTNLPGGTAGQPYSQNFTASGGTSPYSFTTSAGTLPPGVTLATNGTLAGTPAGFGIFNFTVKATDANGCFGERTYAWRICAIISLTASLPAGTTGTAYSQTITASGGASPYSFMVMGGNLPAGLNLNSSGALSGTPIQSGSFNFTVTAADANGCTGTQSYTLGIGCQTVTVNPASVANGFVATAYNQSLTATGGTAPYSFTVSTGTLPGGLNLASGGALTGTPATQASFSFTVRATDANGCFGERGYTVFISGSGLQFYPLATPVRLLDTRPGASLTACSQPNAPIAGGTSRTQSARAFCGIPANAAAITGNITTVESGGGYLTLYPSNAAQPLVATTNYNPGEVVNNVFTVGLGAGDGAFKIFALNTTDIVVDVTGYYALPGSGGLFFHPLPKPIRLLETRPGEPGCNTPGTPIVGGVDTPRQARITCAGVTIPTGALAIAGNATTVGPQGPGYLTLFPASASRPFVATSNYATNQIVNGPFTVGLSAAGQFNIYSLATTDLVIDVLGYYSAEVNDANGQGLLFSALPRPVRLLETRAGEQGCFAPGAPLTGGTEYTQQARGLCNGETIPTTAQGVVGNATVVNAQGGFLTLWPSQATRPLVATSNFSAGQIVNRHFTVGLGTDGVFKLYSLLTTDLVIDLAGYFAP